MKSKSEKWQINGIKEQAKRDVKRALAFKTDLVDSFLHLKKV